MIKNSNIIFSLLPRNFFYNTLITKNGILCNLSYRLFTSDLELYFYLDLNILREKYLLPYIDKFLYTNCQGHNVEFLIIIKHIICLQIDDTFYSLLQASYTRFNDEESKLFILGISYLKHFYNVEIADHKTLSLSFNDLPPLKKLMLKNFLRMLASLNKGIYPSISEISAWNYIDYKWQQLLIEEVKYIRAVTSRIISNDIALIEFIYGMSFEKTNITLDNKALFSIDSMKIGGAEKQFKWLYTLSTEALQTVDVATNLISFRDNPINSLTLRTCHINDKLKFIRLFKHHDLKKRIYNSVITLLSITPKYVVSSMHYCCFGNLIATQILGLPLKHYVRIGNELPHLAHQAHLHLAKYDMIQRIYELNKDRLTIIVNCHYLAQEYRNFLPNLRIVTQYNVITVPSSQKLLPFEKGFISIGFVGRNTSDKNLKGLVELFGQTLNFVAQDIRLIIYVDKIDENLLNYVANLDFVKLITLVEGETNKDIIYKNIDIFVSLSLREGLPNSIMEAISYHIPCVAFNTGGTNEVIEFGKTGFVVNNTEEALAQLVELVNDQNLRNFIKEYNRTHFFHKFSKEKLINNIIQEIHNITLEQNNNVNTPNLKQHQSRIIKPPV